MTVRKEKSKISTMAISLRRAVLSCRNISLLIRTSRHFSHVSSSTYFSYHVPSHAVPNSPAIDFLFEFRRGFAKGRKQWDEDEDDDDFGSGGGSGDVNRVEVVNVGPTIKAAAVSQMEAAIDALTNELGKLRTGRASAGMLDHIIVETGGVKMPLNRIAVVSVLDPKTLAISPYDPNAVKELEKAIVSSPLGLNPKTDGQRLIAAIPPLTKEHMQAVCKVVAKSSEDVKQSIRRARQKALDAIKKSVPKDNKKKEKDKDKDKKKDKRKEEAVSGFSSDDAKRLEKEVEELTKKYIKTADEMCKTKEKEITSS